MRRTALLLLVAVLSLAFAPAPLPRPLRPANGEEDLKQMQGRWLRLSSTQGGNTPVITPLNDVAVIAGNRITVAVGKPGSTTWALTLGSGKAPRTIDYALVGGAEVWPGIYELKGDTLRICYVAAGGIRPSSMRPSREGEYLQVLQRQKP